MDEVLEMLAGYGPEFAGGLSNHGPMVADALHALDRGAAARPWADAYRARLEPRPQSFEPIDRTLWTAALGDFRRARDWEELFEHELAEAAWRDVLARWMPRLLPGLVGGAAHGVLRTGHAAHALAAEETPPRLRELAWGLGYWAARFQRLPGDARRTGALSPEQALARVTPLPDELRAPSGLISVELADLERFPPFAEVVSLVDPGAGTPDFLSELLASFAGVYLRGAARRAIALLHAFTGPAALRDLAPYLDDADRRMALGYAWQAAAALHARYGAADPATPLELVEVDPETLADRAVENGDEHAIKLTAACLRAWRSHPDARLLNAANDALGRL